MQPDFHHGLLGITWLTWRVLAEAVAALWLKRMGTERIDFSKSLDPAASPLTALRQLTCEKVDHALEGIEAEGRSH